MINVIKLLNLAVVLTLFSSQVLATPPTAEIISPTDQDVANKGGVILLEGNGIDAEDGILPSTNLQWTSDKDGPLGTGNVINSELSKGSHNITLIVTDSMNETGTAVVIVNIN